MNILDKNKIMITAIKDPFDPYNSRIIEYREWEEKNVFNYMKEIYPLIPEDCDVVVSINGKIIKDVHNIFPDKGDNLVFCLVLGDDVLRTVAFIAVAIVSIYLPPVWGLTGIYAATASVVMATAGALIINAVLPPQMPSLGGTGSFESTSPTYSWGALDNPSEEGFPWPVIYGTVRIFPYLIGKYIDDASEIPVQQSIYNGGGMLAIIYSALVPLTLKSKQYLNLLFCIADHSVNTIDSIEINENDFDQYEGVSSVKRYGSNTQTVIPNFNDTIQGIVVGDKLSTSWSASYTTPRNDTQEIIVGVNLPNGLFYVNDDGGMSNTTISISIQFRPTSGGSWVTWIPNDITAGQKTAITKKYKIQNLSPNEYEVQVRLTGALLSGLRYSNDAYFDFLQSKIYDDFTYPGVSLLSIKALATDQLSGEMPRISTLVTRSTVPVWTGTQWTNKAATNPAWACYDMLVNQNYGGGVAPGRMLYQEFSNWADFCTTNGYVCNMYFDVFSSFPEALAKISTIGRGRVVQRGTQFGVVVDKADSPVQLFGVGNIIENTFRESYLSLKDRANVVEISYFDATKSYSRQTFEIRSDTFDADTDIEEKKIAIVLYACTSKTIALKYAKFLLNCNKYFVRNISFEVGVDAIASQVGDVVWVSHDVPQWGYSGRVLSASSNTIQIDREVTLSPGTTYHILVRHSDDDALEEVAIESVTVETTTNLLRLSSVWSQIPIADDVYTFGIINRVAKEFRINSITRSQEMTRRIEALEYRSEVYSDSITIPDYEQEYDLPSVSYLRATEPYNNSTNLSYISLTWMGVGVHRIWMKDDLNTAWSLLSMQAGKNSYAILGQELNVGTKYYFAVSATTNPEEGEQVSITYRGWVDRPIIWPIRGLQIQGQGNSTTWQDRDVKLEWNLSTSAFVSVAGGDLLGAGTFPPLTDFGGYRIAILNPNLVVRRDFFQFENSYTYLYDQNVADGNGTPSANLIIKVWARDKYGNESEQPAVLTISNPAPSAVSGLSATPYMGAVLFSWKANTESDFAYYEYRIKVETDDWSAWTHCNSTEKFRALTEAEKTTYGVEARIHIEVRAYDTFGSVSSSQITSTIPDSLNIDEADIANFAITASKIFTKIPILEGDVWISNSPAQGYVAWNAHTLYYNGTAYSIVAGNTDQKYIYWDSLNSNYTHSNTNPTLADNEFIIATNIDGYYDLAWNAIANQVIGSAYIQDLAVSNAKISSLSAEKINAGYINADRIEAASIAATKLNVSTLSSITANIGTVTAGIAKSSDNKFTIDFNNKWLKVWDASNVLRVHLGYIA